MEEATLEAISVYVEHSRYTLAPANADLTGAEVGLLDQIGRELRLRYALEAVRERYDYVIIDCPPALNMLTVNALAAADSVMIPVQCEYYALEGLSALLDTIEKIRRILNHDLQIDGLLRTMFDPRNNLSGQVSQQLMKHFGDKVYSTVIPRNVRLAEAPSHGLRRCSTTRTRVAPLPTSRSRARCSGATERTSGLRISERTQMVKKRGLGRGSRRPARRCLGRIGREGRKAGFGRHGRRRQFPPAAGGRHPPRQAPAAADRRGVHPRRARTLGAGARHRPADRRAPGRTRELRDRGRGAALEGRQMAGLHEVPAVVRECSDREAAAVALIENIQREDLNPIEEAEGYRTLADEFGLTHQELADAVGRSRSSVSNALRLLDLNDDVRALVEQGELDMGHARALLALSGPAQSETAEEVVRRGLSARETEKLVRSKAKQGSPPAPATRDSDVIRLETELGERLGAKVRIDHKAKKGTGSVTIHYSSLDALDGILERIR